MVFAPPGMAMSNISSKSSSISNNAASEESAAI
jgi:hypothetical protein